MTLEQAFGGRWVPYDPTILPVTQHPPPPPPQSPQPLRQRASSSGDIGTMREGTIPVNPSALPAGSLGGAPSAAMLLLATPPQTETCTTPGGGWGGCSRWKSPRREACGEMCSVSEQQQQQQREGQQQQGSGTREVAEAAAARVGRNVSGVRQLQVAPRLSNGSNSSSSRK